jgi:hypothetical protein
VTVQNIPKLDPAVLSAAFVLVFRQGRSPPSCPMPDDNDLLNRIRDAVPSASPAAGREALIRVRRLSFDVVEVCGALQDGEYGSGDEALAAALADLEGKDPGFSKTEYRTAFAVGQMWARLQ